jgi:hypothetical protein
MLDFMPGHRRSLAFLFGGLLVLAPALALAQQDKTAERAARRLQLQMQNLQQQLQDAQAAKAKADADSAAAAKQLAEQTQETSRAQQVGHKASEGLKAMQLARDEMAARVAALERQFTEQKQAGDLALARKDADLAQLAKARDAQVAQLQARFDEQTKQVASCSDKNQRLVRLGADLLDRYRRKGVADALKQSEPFLGLSDVQMFNLVQDYRDKIDAEHFVPESAKAPPPP